MEGESTPQADPSLSLFDCYADGYDCVLNRALAASGERKDYFAHIRGQWLRKQLQQLGFQPRSVLDFGCGNGSAVAYLLHALQADRILGVDISAQSVERAREEYGGARIEFAVSAHYSSEGEFDLAHCNGVFHHIPASEHATALRYIYNALCPGGFFALWENNPWNPGTRYIMARCEFDRDAILFNILEARKLLRRCGFEVLHTSTQFYFPRSLKWLRWTEPALARLPLGGQYLVLCRKSE